MSDILTGWTNVNEDAVMVSLLVDPVAIRTRYLPTFLLLGLEILSMSRRTNGRFSPKNSSSGKGPKSIENMFRVTPIVTLNFVSGESHVLVSSIVHVYSIYRVTSIVTNQ